MQVMKPVKRYSRWLWLFLIIITVVFLLRMNVEKSFEEKAVRGYAVQGWPFSSREEPYSEVMTSAREGLLVINLPDQLEQGDCLCFYLNKQSVLISQRGSTLYTFKSTDSDRWYFIPLSSSLQGQTLWVNFSSTISRSPGMLRSVYFGTESACREMIWKDMWPGILLCLAVCISGIVFLVLGFYCRDDLEIGIVIRYVGIMLILLSVWGISNLPLTRLILEDTNTLHYVGRVCILLAPLALVTAVRILVHVSPYNLETDFFFAFFGLLGISSVVLDLVNICSLAVSSSWSQTLSIVFILYLLLFVLLGPAGISKQKHSRFALSRGWGIIAFVSLFFFCFEAWFSVGSYLSISPVVTWILFVFCCLSCIAMFVFVLKEAAVLLRLQEKLLESRTRLMLSQMKPHFIYNTLNSIRNLIWENADTADTLVLQFSKYLRNNMRFLGSEELIPFSQELELIKAYVAIEETCYPRLSVLYDIGVHNFWIPPLTIQPLVENAIRHGVLKKNENGKIILRTWETYENYFVEVKDTGVGFIPEDALAMEDSYGLRNTRLRLEQLMKAEMTINSILGMGSSVSIRFPKAQREDLK